MALPAVSATCDEPCSRHNSPPNQANSPRYPPPLTRAAGLHDDAHEDRAGHVLVQAVAQLAEKLSAQLAAQMSSLSTMMPHFEEMRTASAPSQPKQPTTTLQPARPSVLDVNALAGAPLCLYPPPSALTSSRHADAYALLVAASRLNPLNTEPLALLTLSTVAGPAVYPANKTNQQRASPFAPPTLSAVPGAAVFAPNPPTTQSIQPSLQYISAFSQYAPVRVTSTVIGPTDPQPLAPSALDALAAFAALKPSAHPPAVPLQSAALTPVALPESYVVTTAQPLEHSPAIIYQIASSAGAQFAVAHPAARFQAACAQFAAPTAAQPVAQIGAQPAVYALPAAPAGGNQPVSPPTGMKRTQTRCSNSRVAHASLKCQATIFDYLLSTSSSTYACARAECTTGVTFCWLRLALRKHRKFGAHM